MARLIPEGGFAVAEATCPAPDGGFTRAAVRALLGAPAPARMDAFPLPTGGYLFARRPSPDLVGTFSANLRASALCGWLIYGPAVVTLPAERIDWDAP